RDRNVTGVQTCALPIYFVDFAIEVVPLAANGESRHYLILFQDALRPIPLKLATPSKSRAKSGSVKESDEIERLQKELVASREYRSEERRVGEEGGCGQG